MPTTTLNGRSFTLEDVPAFKQKMLNWVNRFGIFCYLDNGGYRFAPQQAECLVAVGVADSIEDIQSKKADAFFAKKQWVFGHLAYELMHDLHHLPVTKKVKTGFPACYFFAPQMVLEIRRATLTVHAGDPQAVFNDINQQPPVAETQRPSAVKVQAVLRKDEYIRKIHSLQAHILRGDCYEINFCQEFFAEGVDLFPLPVFGKLMAVSPTPFAAFYRLHNQYLLCASPERFLLKQGAKLLSQPMKGTMRREAEWSKDEVLKETLRQSAKDQAENVMVVDLVRNDLTRVCTPGSVKVDELFGIQTFPQVHQMVSTVSGELRSGVSFPRILEALFPMGSMTGAPKHRVMQLIDEYEPSARGIFSGSVGYINPGGDFDFNVVIRSLMYNAATKYLSYQVGSGITFYSEPEKEWEECLLKAEAIRKVLEE